MKDPSRPPENRASGDTPRERGAIIDPDRCKCLCDVGEPRYLACVAVGPDGVERYWLARKKLLLADVDAEHGDPNQRHELGGRLPADIWQRIWLRCGRPARSRGGLPCRLVVEKPGQACSVHSAEATR